MKFLLAKLFTKNKRERKKENTMENEAFWEMGNFVKILQSKILVTCNRLRMQKQLFFERAYMKRNTAAEMRYCGK